MSLSAVCSGQPQGSGHLFSSGRVAALAAFAFGGVGADDLNAADAFLGLPIEPPQGAAVAGATFGQEQKMPGKIDDVINFALTLEYLEDEFYRTAVGSSGLIPSETRAVFEQISKHEARMSRCSNPS